jgi:DNA polymerase-2
MTEFSGWLLDLFENPGGGISLWFIGVNGKRQRFLQKFPATFFMRANDAQVVALKRFLAKQNVEIRLSYQERYDLFARKALRVLAVEVQNAYQQPALFRKALREFPDLQYYDADVALSLRHAAIYNTFPLAFCRLMANDQGWIQELKVMDTPWDIDTKSPPLRILRMGPDASPEDSTPQSLVIQYASQLHKLSLEPKRALLINLKSIFQRYDPDILLTRWGDTWLLPWLIEMDKEVGIGLPWNREPGRSFGYRAERSYFSYGQIIYRGQQIHLFGRIHIDQGNAMFWSDYELDGILEMSRLTRLPIQTAARQSSGTGISSMEIVTALSNGMLVPYQKQQAEHAKTALELLHSDQGGLVYQPLTGLHTNVGEIDFISMYPSIMVRCNISPETDPSLALEPSDEPPGLIPQTLAPLLDKRIRLKQLLAEMPGWDPRREHYKQLTSAQKWLLVTCFGYLGYKNARFGRIESHEAITANGREALLRAKEAAEARGFLLLHMYVDGLWVQKEGARRPEDFQDLLDAIAERTGLSISLNGIYRWVAFLPSRVDQRVPVANRYFGVFQDGSIKMRGIETRRHDTAPFIAATQLEILQHLAGAEDVQELKEKYLDGAIAILRMRLHNLLFSEVPLDQLLVSQRLSRELEAYTVPSPPARAYAQLHQHGKILRPGQRVRFLYTLDEAGVRAWGLPEVPDPRILDTARYKALLIQAAGTLVQPFGWDEDRLSAVVSGIPAEQDPLPMTRIKSPSFWSEGLLSDTKYDKVIS